VSLAENYKIPIHAVGVGEGLDDLQTFKASSFSMALAGLDET
jgi:fused signal recognition particle receptor